MPFLLRHRILSPKRPQPIDIAIVRFPRIANFDDFDPLVGEVGVSVSGISTHPMNCKAPAQSSYRVPKAPCPTWHGCTVRGWNRAIRQFALDGGVVVGICGGYQMLGQEIKDPEHVESTRSEANGLGLLEIETTFEADKSTYQIHAEIHSSAGWMADMDNDPISGYEIHMGARHIYYTGDHWLTHHTARGYKHKNT